MGSIEGCCEVTILSPTSDEMKLRPSSPAGRRYTVYVTDRNQEHILAFQELDDGLRVTMEPRQVTGDSFHESDKQPIRSVYSFNKLDSLKILPIGCSAS